MYIATCPIVGILLLKVQKVAIEEVYWVSYAGDAKNKVVICASVSMLRRD
jgi:hypothetical protein